MACLPRCFVFAVFGASLALGARSSINVTSAMNTLQTYYDVKSGMYGKCPGYSHYRQQWQTLTT